MNTNQRSKSDPVRVAVVGCGSLAQMQHLPNIVRSPRMSLYTCCDIAEHTLDQCRERFQPLRLTRDVADVASDPEVELVVIAAAGDRLALIRACAEAGKPMYIEKPVADTLEELDQVERVVEATGIPVCVGHNRRSAPALLDAHRIFHSYLKQPNAQPWRFDREGPDVRPKLPDDGAPYACVRVNDDWYSWKGWAFDKRLAPHGLMVLEMTHFTDLCNWFIGSEPVEVIAMESGMLNHGVVICYANQGMATISMGANGTHAYPKELYEFMGGGAIVVVDHLVEVRTAGIDAAPARKVYPFVNDRHPDVGTEGGLSGWLAKKRAACAEAAAAGDPLLQLITAEPDKGHGAALERFIDEVWEAGPTVCDIRSAALATRVAFAAVESAKTGQAVKLADL